MLLLLTDMGLPGGINGQQLANIVRHKRPHLKVLFIIGYAGSIIVGDGQMDWRMQVMNKPFSMKALAARVHDMISDGLIKEAASST